jgi:hypothetical protein
MIRPTAVRRRRARRPLAAGAVLLALPLLPGCIVGEIRDELVRVNAGLDRVDSRLVEVDERLAAIDANLAAIDQQLDGISPQLAPLPNLEQLQSLGTITTSLQMIEEHLVRSVAPSRASTARCPSCGSATTRTREPSRPRWSGPARLRPPPGSSYAPGSGWSGG